MSIITKINQSEPVIFPIKIDAIRKVFIALSVEKGH